MRVVSVCAECGEDFEHVRSGGPVAQYCSRKCKYRASKARGTAYYPRCFVRFKECSECGRVYCARSGKGLTCSAECRKVASARRMRERYAADPVAGRLRMAKVRANFTEVQRVAMLERHRAWIALQGGRAVVNAPSYQARRARKSGVTAEVFSPVEIYDRDAWICGICGGDIDSGARYPDPLSVSLDHVIPLSLGGPHSRSNTRPAHLQCNVRRGNRMESEPLAL